MIFRAFNLIGLYHKNVHKHTWISKDLSSFQMQLLYEKKIHLPVRITWIVFRDINDRNSTIINLSTFHQHNNDVENNQGTKNTDRQQTFGSII